VSVIQDPHEMYFCRDCGTPVSDDAMLARVQQVPGHAEMPPLLDDDGGPVRFVEVPGACTSCGGGRLVIRIRMVFAKK
jgi:hypothetical protein